MAKKKAVRYCEETGASLAGHPLTRSKGGCQGGVMVFTHEDVVDTVPEDGHENTENEASGDDVCGEYHTCTLA